MLLVTGLAAAVRMYSLMGQSLWRDEVDALRLARLPLASFLAQFAGPGQNGPLYFLALRPWIALTGTTEFSLRYGSVLGGVLAVAMLYALGRRLAGPLAGGLAALLLALSPYNVWYSQEAKMYSWLVYLVLLSLYSLHRSLEQRQVRWWVAYLVVTSLVLYTHILAALLLPVELVLMVLWSRQQTEAWAIDAREEPGRASCQTCLLLARSKFGNLLYKPGRAHAWLAPALAFAALTLPYLPLLLWQVPYSLTPATTGYPFYPLPEMLGVMWTKFSQGELAPALPWASLGLGLAAVAGLLLPGRMKDAASDSSFILPPSSFALLIWFALPLVLLYLVSLRRPVFTDRYLIWLGPALYLLAGRGLARLGRRSFLLAGLPLVWIVFLDSSALLNQTTTPFKSDFRSAATYVANRYQPGELIIFQAPYIRYTFSYYFAPGALDDPTRYFDSADGLYTNSGIPPAQVQNDMLQLVHAHHSVWLISSESDAWDQRQLVARWLRSHGRLLDRRQYARVDVYRFEMR